MDAKKPTCVAAPSPRASLGRCTVCGRAEQRRPPVSKPYETKVRMIWGSFLIAAAALKTPTRNGIMPKASTSFLTTFDDGRSDDSLFSRTFQGDEPLDTGGSRVLLPRCLF